MDFLHSTASIYLLCIAIFMREQILAYSAVWTGPFWIKISKLDDSVFRCSLRGFFIIDKAAHGTDI